jgi:polysaccharide export outer membrane protein
MDKNNTIKEMQLRNRKMLYFALVIIISACYAHSQEKYLSGYKIGPKDVLEISVLGDNELSRIYKVAENGTITLPYLGDIQVSGLDKSELEKNLTELLEEKDILENPQVIILIREYASQVVYVLGAVQTPGIYELAARLTLRQVIAQAGGETSDAGDKIEIIRYGQEGTNAILHVSEKDLYTDIDYDIVLEPNDMVRVLHIEMAWIYVGGQVNSPGRFEVIKSNIPTLLQAIILAGDFTGRASEGSVILRRMDEQGNWNGKKYDVDDIIKGKEDDIQLQPNDIVIVPKSVF